MTAPRPKRPSVVTAQVLRFLAACFPIRSDGAQPTDVLEASLPRLPSRCVGAALRIDLLSPARLGLVLGLASASSAQGREPSHHQLRCLSLDSEEVVLDWDDLERLDESSVRIFVEPLHELGVRAIRDARREEGEQRVTQIVGILRLREDSLALRPVRELLTDVAEMGGLLTQISVPSEVDGEKQLTQARCMVTVPRHRLSLLFTRRWQDPALADRIAGTIERHFTDSNYVHCDVSLSGAKMSAFRTLTAFEEPQRQRARLQRAFSAIRELGGRVALSLDALLAAHQKAVSAISDVLPPATLPLEIELDWTEGELTRARVWCGFLPQVAPA